MALSVDKIKKLIELACNNSNESEANRASRKVCQEIKDSNFKLLNSSFNPESPPTRPIYEPTHRQRQYTDPFNDIYETIRRASQKAEERERKRQEDLLEKLRKEREERTKKEKEPKFTQKENPPKWNWGYNPSDAQRDFFASGTRPNWDFDSVFYDNLRRKPNERRSEERECSKCGVKIRTFRIKEEPFVCNICQWSHWEKER